jgi:hypothetical protein
MTQDKANNQERYFTLRGDPAAQPFWKTLHRQPDLQLLGLAVMYNVASRAGSAEDMALAGLNGFLGVLAGHGMVRLYEEIKLQLEFKKSSQELSETIIDKNPGPGDLSTLANLSASEKARYNSMLSFGIALSAVAVAEAAAPGDSVLFQFGRTILGFSEHQVQLPSQVYAVLSILLRTPSEYLRHSKIVNGEWVIKNYPPENKRQDNTPDARPT